MNTSSNNTELAKLQRKVARMEKRLAQLEQERDEARRWLVEKQQFRIINGWRKLDGQYLPHHLHVAVKGGEMALADAVALVESTWPVLTYPEALPLADAYRMAV